MQKHYFLFLFLCCFPLASDLFCGPENPNVQEDVQKLACDLYNIPNAFIFKTIFFKSWCDKETADFEDFKQFQTTLKQCIKIVLDSIYEEHTVEYYENIGKKPRTGVYTSKQYDELYERYFLDGEFSEIECFQKLREFEETPLS
jgi:hypothetical protein